eukprot:SAG25_NODE_3934_length_925_cov_0.554479_2_plen_105_part_00
MRAGKSACFWPREARAGGAVKGGKVPKVAAMEAMYARKTLPGGARALTVRVGALPTFGHAAGGTGPVDPDRRTGRTPTQQRLLRPACVHVCVRAWGWLRYRRPA